MTTGDAFDITHKVTVDVIVVTSDARFLRIFYECFFVAENLWTSYRLKSAKNERLIKMDLKEQRRRLQITHEKREGELSEHHLITSGHD